MPERTTKIAPALLASVLITTWVCDASAQSRRAPDLVGEPAARAEAATDEVRVIARQTMADTLTSLATQSIRLAPSPTSSDYRFAALTLAIASELEPDEVERLRLLAAAWDQSGDYRRAVDVLRRVIELDPRDGPALLRVINARVRELQTADARLSAYEKLIAAEQLPPGLRSRVALDAALLARETGDELGFIEKLTLATTLDVSNEDAARVYAQYYLEEGGDPIDRVDVLSNLILSAPLKSEHHHQLARELMRLGAFDGAKRWVRLAIAAETAAQTYRRFGAVSNPTISNELQFDELLCVWNADGPLACVNRLRADARAVAQMREQQRIFEERQGGNPDTVPPALLHYRSEVLWFMLSAALNDRDATRDIIQRIETWTEVVEQQMNGAIQADAEQAAREGITPESIEAYKRRQSAEQLWLRLLAGIEINKAVEQFTALRDAPGDDALDPDALARFEGWLAVHDANAPEARAHLEPLADRDPGALLGLGRLCELENDTDGAAGYYAKVIALDPSTGVAAYARTRIERVTGSPLPPTPLVERLNEKAGDLAPNLGAMLEDPRAFVSIRAEHVEPRIGPLGRPELDITLRNASRLTLGVGTEQSINPTLLLSPGFQGRGHEQVTSVEAESLWAGRRFSLAPGKEIRMRVWGGRGSVSRILDESLSTYATLRWRIIQGPVYLDDEYATGPNCVSAQSDTLARFPFDMQAATATSLSEQLRLARGVALLEHVKGVAFRIYQLNELVSEEERQSNRQDDSLLRAAMQARMDTMSPDELGFTVYTLARYRQLEGDLLDTALALASARNDTDYTLAMLAFELLREGRGGQAMPLLTRLFDSPHRAVAEFARAVAPPDDPADEPDADPAP